MYIAVCNRISGVPVMAYQDDCVFSSWRVSLDKAFALIKATRRGFCTIVRCRWPPERCCPLV